MKNFNEELSVLNQFSIGFEGLLHELLNQRPNQTQFPKYNIIKKTETDFDLVLALAGYDQEDIDISTKENHLYVSSTKNKDNKEEVEYLYQGIAKRNFKFKMMLHEYTKVIGATMKNGMLIISLENIVPEEKLPKKIEIK